MSFIAGPGKYSEHSHGVEMNRFGDGRTTWTSAPTEPHTHEIEEGKILEHDGHTHEWINSHGN